VWHPNDTWTIYTADPAVIKIIFSDNNTWYKSAGGVPAQMLVGQGLTSVNGEHWKRQRNFITRLFQPSKVRRRGRGEEGKRGRGEEGKRGGMDSSNNIR
jgi:cytochrome P450